MNLSRLKKMIQPLKPRWTRTDWLCALASGVLFALVFPPVEWRCLVWIALIPVLSRIRAGHHRENFWLGFVTGFVYYLGSLHWLTLVTTPGMMALCVYLSLLFSLPFLVMGLFTRAWLRIPAFALSMVLIEYFRSLGVMSFSWGYLGHAFYDTDWLRPAAAWVGIPGLSLPVALFNAAFAGPLAHVASRWREGTLNSNGENSLQPTMLYCAVALIAVGFAAQHELRASTHRMQQASTLPSEALRVALIQGGVPQDQKEGGSIEDILVRHLELSQQSMEHEPDLIVWPESAIPVSLNHWDDGIRRIQSFANQNNVEILIGCVHGEYRGDSQWDYYNRAWLISPNDIGDDEFPTLQGFPYYDKIHLVPYGEWIPLGEYWPFSLIETLIEEAGAGIFRRGHELTLFETRGGHRFTVMICFESTLSWHARQAKRQGADFIINITNDAWFGRSAGLKQHFLQCQFRAAETGLPILRAANTGITGYIDPTGRILKTIPDNQPGICFVELPLQMH